MRPLFRWSFRLAAVFFSLTVGAQSIFTVVGGGTDDGRPATLAALDSPVSTAIDSFGNLYVCDRGNHRVRRVDAVTGIVTTIAGTGGRGWDGDGELATLSQLDTPLGIAIDSEGNLLIADNGNARVRRVDARSGRIETIAGDGYSQYEGDAGPATLASLNNPAGLVADAAGNIYVSDAGNQRIRRISGASGVITTVAGNGTWGDSGDGGPATLASFRLSSQNPSGIDITLTRGLAIDSARSALFVADIFNHKVRRVDLASGLVTTVAGTGTRGFSGDGGPATTATLDNPAGVALSTSGDIYVADAFNDRVRQVSAHSGRIETVAGGGPGGNVGDGGPATGADVRGCVSVTFDADGDLVVASVFDSRVRRVDMLRGTIATVVGTGFPFLSDDGGPALSAALIEPSGIAFDADGRLYIAEMGTGRVRQVAGRTIHTIAGVGFTGESSGDGTVATQTYLDFPMSVAVDSAGDVYVASVGEEVVRKISMASGTIHDYAGNRERGFGGDGGPATAATLSLRSYNPDSIVGHQSPGLVFDVEDNLYIADRFNYRIRKVTRASGIITTVAGNGTAGFAGDGGPATHASMGNPAGLALDPDGNLIFADVDNDRVRRVERATGTIRTIAGGGPPGPPSAGVPATQAVLSGPQGVAVDADGNIYISEIFGERLLRISRQTGVLERVAGKTYEGGFTGDHGPASAARLSGTEGLVARARDIYTAEVGSARVRAILGCVDVGPFALRSPANGSSGVGGMTHLEWSASDGAFSYDVLLDTSNPPRRVAAPNVATTTFSPAGLSPGVTYYWSVVAKGDPFCAPARSATSDVWSFTTANTCEALVMPD